MTNFDLPTLINWLASGFIGFVFGIAGTWVTYRYERNRDDITWKREKEKLEMQFELDKILLEIQFQQKLKEAEQQASQKRSDDIRAELLKGVDNPEKALQAFKDLRAIIGGDRTALEDEDGVSYRVPSRFERRLYWWIGTPKEVKVSIILSFIFASLFFLTVILLISFIYINR